MKDLIIIGAAAAGCSAAVYAARRHLDFSVISKDIGGEVALSGEIENWPGTIHTTGDKLADEFHEHVKDYGIEIQDELEVTDIQQKNNKQIVKIKDKQDNIKDVPARSVIIATGIHPRELNIPGEDKLRDKGLTYCTVCDGPLFEGKRTVTIGAGDAALESALMLSEIASKEYLITKYPNKEKSKEGFPKAEEILIKKAKNNENIEIIYDAMTQEILGSQMVEGVKYEVQSSGKIKTLEVDGVMVHIGMSPNSDFIDCVDKNEAGEIKVNKLCETSCEGIFAAGDVTDTPYKQISIAAGQGTTAALSAIDYLNKLKQG
ncbi:MAG: NAD(P)/FAD-dependent oxidoreductase [Candidatus Paceibacteria bacterium]